MEIVITQAMADALINVAFSTATTLIERSVNSEQALTAEQLKMETYEETKARVYKELEAQGIKVEG